MKKYESPKVEIIYTEELDIVTASVDFGEMDDVPVIGIGNW